MLSTSQAVDRQVPESLVHLNARQRGHVCTGMQLIRIEEDGAYVGLVGGSPKPLKGVNEQIAALPLQMDSRDVRYVTELVSGTATPC